MAFLRRNWIKPPQKQFAIVSVCQALKLEQRRAHLLHHDCIVCAHIYTFTAGCKAHYTFVCILHAYHTAALSTQTSKKPARSHQEINTLGKRPRGEFGPIPLHPCERRNRYWPKCKEIKNLCKDESFTWKKSDADIFSKCFFSKTF